MWEEGTNNDFDSLWCDDVAIWLTYWFEMTDTKILELGHLTVFTSVARWIWDAC
jgi:hypothetical protein